MSRVLILGLCYIAVGLGFYSIYTISSVNTWVLYVIMGVFALMTSPSLLR